MKTNRMLALAVMESIDFMDPTNSREVRPSQRVRRSATPLSVAGWSLLAAIVLLALAAGAR